jgi:hypothetical protein
MAGIKKRESLGGRHKMRANLDGRHKKESLLWRQESKLRSQVFSKKQVSEEVCTQKTATCIVDLYRPQVLEGKHMTEKRQV